MSKPYSVNLWGSDPNEENDDCWTGVEFEGRYEALAFYHSPVVVALREGWKGILSSWNSTAFIEIDGPDIYECRQVGPVVRLERDTLWENEARMQAAMMGDY